MTKSKKKHIDLSELSNKQIEFQLELSNRFSTLEDLAQSDNTLDKDYDDISNIIMEEAEKLAKSKKDKPSHPESCGEIKQLNDRRKALKPTRQHSKINQIEYTELNKTIRKLRRKKKREYRTRMVKEVLERNKGPKIVNRKLEGGIENSYHL